MLFQSNLYSNGVTCEAFLFATRSLLVVINEIYIDEWLQLITGAAFLHKRDRLNAALNEKDIDLDLSYH